MWRLSVLLIAAAIGSLIIGAWVGLGTFETMKIAFTFLGVAMIILLIGVVVTG